jgi:hypothetical protein
MIAFNQIGVLAAGTRRRLLPAVVGPTCQRPVQLESIASRELLSRAARSYAFDEAPDERVLIDSARCRPGLALAGLPAARVISVPGCGPVRRLLRS